jgi:hypothetical protein
MRDQLVGQRDRDDFDRRRSINFTTMDAGWPSCSVA